MSQHAHVRAGVHRASGSATAALVLTAVLASGLPAQDLTLDHAAARSAEGFTNIYAAVELPDGRVLMTDSRERAIVVLDLAAGTVERIGRPGQGPREYLSAFSIVPAPSGGLRVYDASNHRFTLVSDAGEVTGSEAFTPPQGLSGMSPPNALASDGRLYLDIRELGDGGLERAARVYAWDPGTGAADSVGFIYNYQPHQAGRGIIPMPRGDAWSVLPDGSVARVDAGDYHVEWSGGAAGARRGPPIEHERIPVDAAEREAWIEAIYAQPAGGARISGGSGASGSGATRRRREFDPDRFPQYKPPFERGFALASPVGEVWLKLQGPLGATTTRFDVIDRDGRRVRTVTVSGEARVVGFGRDAVYLARKDEVDLEWLEKHLLR